MNFRKLGTTLAACVLMAAGAEAQTTKPVDATATGPGALAGRWTYRSFHNNPAPVTDDANKALGLFFAEAVFRFEFVSDTNLKGTIDWQGGGLDLQGTVFPASGGEGPRLEIVGTGRDSTGTAGWRYDYNGRLAHAWPNGVDQVPAIVGTVIRAKPHGPAQAGYVASFIAVKQP